MKTLALTITFVLGLALPGGGALAHHGWAWTTGKNVDLAGVIKKVTSAIRMEFSTLTLTERSGPSRSANRGATNAPV